MKPQLDHYVGRQIDNIIAGPGKSGQWQISLKGGVIIRNHDKDNPQPPKEIIGSMLLSVTETDQLTKATFGSSTVAFGSASEGQVIEAYTVSFTKPKSYTISVRGMEHDPDEDEPTLEEMLPPDPSAERVADKPSKAVKRVRKPANG